MRVLGVRPMAGVAWLAIVQNGEVLALPDRFELNNEPRPASLLAGLEQAKMLLRHHAIDAMAVVDAQSNAKPNSFKEARRRLTLESLFEIAAARGDVAYHLLSPQAIQAVLGLPTRRIADHVDSVVTGAGTRWAQRGPAALAAVAFAMQRLDQ